MSDYTHLARPEDEGTAKHIKNINIPNISLLNQEGNYLRLDRCDTFRVVIYFFPMTGRPDRPLPHNWNNIPEARGSTMQTCRFRDKYDELISLNAVPIGISTQSVDDNKEMTNRLGIPYDILSDEKLELQNILKLPTFSTKDKFYIKLITIIVENKIIKKVFYPIYSTDTHIVEVLKWLKEN